MQLIHACTDKHTHTIIIIIFHDSKIFLNSNSSFVMQTNDPLNINLYK